jgi:hypothetical protein
VQPEIDSLVLQGIGEPGYEFLRHPHKSSDGRDVPGCVALSLALYGWLFTALLTSFYQPLLHNAGR